MKTADIKQPMGVMHYLLKPDVELKRLKEINMQFSHVPVIPWLIFILIAFAGTLLFGWSMKSVFNNADTTRLPIQLTIATAVSWCVFGPLLIKLTNCNKWICAHACLVTMTWGELVLFVGTLSNFLYWVHNPAPMTELFNLGVIITANMVMAGTLAFQFKAVGVSIRNVLFLWVSVLNGVGVGLFLLLGM